MFKGTLENFYCFNVWIGMRIECISIKKQKGTDTWALDR